MTLNSDTSLLERTKTSDKSGFKNFVDRLNEQAE